jgi:hypothetical protein
MNLPSSSTSAVIEFTVNGTGQIDFAAALDGYVTGRGTNTLKVNGFPIGIDTKAR